MSDAAIGGQATVRYTRGALYGLAAVGIWSGWIVVARLGLRTSLTPWDIAALRFGVAGILLLPYVLVKGFALERLGGVGLAAIVFGGAAPVLLANSGLLFASAADAGALFPGVMPFMVALLAAAFLRETFTKAKKIGFTMILPGVLGIAWGSDGGIGSSANVGDVLFLGSGLAWAFYTIAMRRARLGGLHAAAISAVGAMLLYLPVFTLTTGTTLAKAPWSDIVLQGFVQGVLTAIISLLLYGRAVGVLGASSGAAFARPLPSNDSPPGHPYPWRMAQRDRMDRNHLDFCRSLRGERRPATTSNVRKRAAQGISDQNKDIADDSSDLCAPRNS